MKWQAYEELSAERLADQFCDHSANVAGILVIVCIVGVFWFGAGVVAGWYFWG